MEIIPTQDHLLIEPEIASNRPFGSIIVPDQHLKALSQGKVLDKGPSCTDTIQAGDTVCFSMHSDTPLNIGSEKRKYAIVPEHQVLCIIRKERMPVEIAELATPKKEPEYYSITLPPYQP